MLDLAVIVSQFSCCFCWIWLLVLLDLTGGFCWFLILALVGLDSWCVGLLLAHCLVGFWSSQLWYPIQTIPSWFVRFWFCLVWFFLVQFGVFATFLCPSYVDLFSWLGVQGGHSFEPIYWLFAVVDFSALSLTYTWTLVSYSSCLPRLL